jgi:hypothetical protein
MLSPVIFSQLCDNHWDCARHCLASTYPASPPLIPPHATSSPLIPPHATSSALTPPHPPSHHLIRPHHLQFFWRAPDSFQALYERICEYLELDERVEVLNARFAVRVNLL